MAGIVKTLETFDDLGKLSVDLIAVFKGGGVRLGMLPTLLDMVTQISELIKDAPAALPELQELDAQEAAMIGGAAFSLVKKVIVALSAV